MAKKKEAVIEINRVNDLDPTNHDKQKEINAQLAEIMKDPSINRPSQDEVTQFQAMYEEAAQAFGIARWSVGTPEDGRDILNFIRHFSRERHMWKENQWMGVVKMQEELNQVESAYDLGGKKAPINFGYQALEFLFHMLQNPGGIGYQSALDFESDHEIYAKVFDAVGESLNDSRNALKEVDFAQQKWAAAAQGFYLEKDAPIDEEEGGKDNGNYFDEELGREVKPGEKEYDIAKFQKIMTQKYGGLQDPLTQEEAEIDEI